MQAGKEPECAEVLAESEGMARRLIDWINVTGQEIAK